MTARASMLVPGLLLASCAHFAPCNEGDVRLTTDFEAAAGESCRRTGEAAFRIDIVPETTPINPSPWYAFKIVSNQPQHVAVRLIYREARHRYRPKILAPEEPWREIASDRVEVGREGRRARIAIDVGSGETVISAQPLITTDDHRSYEAEIAERGAARLERLGASLEGRLLTMLVSDADEPDAPLVLFVGRQHPPETPGAVAMFAFLDRIFADDSLATSFRQSVHIRAATLLNPDGVARGYWRTSAGLVDLNRDWGLFAQPETQAVRDLLEREAAAGRRPTVLVDFHATNRDVFYTLPDDAGVSPANFARDWLAEMEAMTGVAPSRRASWSKDRPIAKNWFPVRWGGPALTAEFGDETPPEEVARLGRIAAVAFMKQFVDDI